MKPKITIWKSLGFLFLEIGLAIAFISGYTMMGKGVHVYDFLNKDAHYDAAWYIGVSCFGVFFLLWLLDADVILRHERKKMTKLKETHEDDSSDDESGEGRVGDASPATRRKRRVRTKTMTKTKRARNHSTLPVLERCYRARES